MKINLDCKKTLILVALEKELPKRMAPSWNIHYTGVGKVNAALAVAKFYQIYKPDLIINFGTAGSLNDNLNGLVQINTFKQRDMDVSPLGFPFGDTPFDDLSSITYDYDGYSCGTGDSFVTGKQNVISDIVDMESFSIAKFCYINHINFYCFKFISDHADADAVNDWSLNLKNGANHFIKNILIQK
jgi:adenosylhomocysteine nucleosidase